MSVTDPAGNESERSDALQFQIDTTKLELQILEVQDNVGNPQGRIDAIADGGATNDATPTFVGTATAGATVTIYEGVNVVATTIANASGHWSVELPLQADGKHSYRVEALNVANDKVEDVLRV